MPDARRCRRLFVALGLAVSVSLVACVPGRPDDPSSHVGPAVAVELTAEQTTIEAGQTPSFHVRLTNLTDRSILLVRSLDGSGSGMRYPILAASRVGPTDPEPLLRCGNTDNLRDHDFTAVEPGASLNPFGPGVIEHWVLGRPLVEPGEYTFTLTYDTDQTDPAAWWGVMSPEPPPRRLKRLLERVPKGVYVSEPVTITVVEPVREADG
jgi:hypothetical protein